MTPHITTGPGVTFRRCQWCGQDFDGYQDEPYHEDCAPKAAGRSPGNALVAKAAARDPPAVRAPAGPAGKSTAQPSPPVQDTDKEQQHDQQERASTSDLLDDNPFQPRQRIDPKTLELMADSIRGVGLLQAPVGRRMEDGRVQIAYGHRRVAACKLLRDRGEWGPSIDMDVAEVGETTDEKMAVMAIAENVARQRLTQIEVVRAHRRAIDETGLSIQGLADELGVSRSALSNNLRVLELPDFVLEHVESGALRVSVAREFLVLQNATHCHLDDMREVIKAIADSYRVRYHGDLPNWSRKNVRMQISEQVANNEQDFRPLGPRAGWARPLRAGRRP